MKKILIVACVFAFQPLHADLVTNLIYLCDSNNLVVYAGGIVVQQTTPAEYVNLFLLSASLSLPVAGYWVGYRRAKEAINVVAAD